MPQNGARSKTSRLLWLLLVVIVIGEQLRKKPLVPKQQKHQSFEQSVHELEARLNGGRNRGIPGGASVYRVCTQRCDTQQTSPPNVSAHIKQVPKIHGVFETQVADESSLDLYDPPIPIIGTDHNNARKIYASDVAMFQAHINIWRDLFHGDSSWTLVFNCRVTNIERMIMQLAGTKIWDKMTSEFGGHDFKWDMLMLTSAQSSESASNAPEDMVQNAAQIQPHDIHAYALGKRGSEILLSHTRAFTLPLHEFLDILLERARELRVGRMATTSVYLSQTCEKRTRFVASSSLPFYPPLHWTYTTQSRMSRQLPS
ncbi:hypothetical protein FGB62_95g042 [Gracilaria domingensis]|nr:hypothetical protein FGB62_95g042 [Gracilaria domingensis]